MIERLNNTEGVKRSQATAGQRELVREQRNKSNDVIDNVKRHQAALESMNNSLSDLQETVYAAPEDEDDIDNICDDCAFDALVDELQDLDDHQLMRVRYQANRLLEERSQEDMVVGDDLDDETEERADVGFGVVVTNYPLHNRSRGLRVLTLWIEKRWCPTTCGR